MCHECTDIFLYAEIYIIFLFLFLLLGDKNRMSGNIPARDVHIYFHWQI